MNIAIIGGSGFIGTYTTRELISYDHNVTIIDTNIPDSIFTDKEMESINRIKCNALNFSNLKASLSDKSIDAVYMLAAISDSKENHNDIQHAVNTNIMCLTNTLKAMEELNIPRIIFSSTVWVYSVCKNDVVDEMSDLSISDSDHIYTTCKLTCESIIKNYCSVRNIDYTILRYGIAYGPGCHPDTVLSKFINNALTGVPLTITGNGLTYRNFLYVTDHARGNRLALSDKAKNQIINLDGPDKITLFDVVNRVTELSDKSYNVTVNHMDRRKGDYNGKTVNNNKSKEILNWIPSVDFLTGSENLYNFIKNEK